MAKHLTGATAPRSINIRNIGRWSANHFPHGNNADVVKGSFVTSRATWAPAWLMRQDRERGNRGWAEGCPNWGGPRMCDYSLHSVKSRPAKVGDKLTTHDFGTGTRGFAASEDVNVAVCVLPGTELSFAEEVRCLPTGLIAWRIK